MTLVPLCRKAVIVLLSSRSKGQVGYPSDVSDEEWGVVAPYLALCREDAAQRSHSL